MGNANKQKAVYTKAQIIKMIARSVRVRQSLVKKVYEGLEDEIMRLLASANENEDVVLRLFEGISIDGEFLPHKEKVNNLTGKNITTLERIKAKAKITRNYCDKLLNYENLTE